ncbi:MAG: GGDEF domain-containing protein [Gammaproteobacteria bacterium]|nr:GGDEF domain-containing protein [Gammaproteobacteria bacterium]
MIGAGQGPVCHRIRPVAASVIAWILVTLLGLSGCTAPPSSDQRLPLGGNGAFLFDRGATLSAEDVLLQAGGESFTPLARHQTRLGYNADHLWLHVQPPTTFADGNFHVVLDPALLDEVELHHFRRDASVRSKRLTPHQPLLEREVPIRGFGFRVRGYDAGQDTLLLSVRTEGNLALNGWLLDDRGLERHRIRNAIRDTLFLGSMLPLIVLNLLLFAVLRARSLLYLSLFAMATVGHHLISHDLLAILGPEQPFAAPHRLYLAAILLSGLGAMLFTRHALILPRANPRLDQIIVGVAAVIGVSLLAVPLLPLAWLYPLTVATSLVGTPIMLIAAAIRWRQGDPTARILVLTWSILLLGIILMTTYRAGWLPVPVVTEANTYLLSVLSVLLLTFAIVHRLLVLGDPRTVGNVNMNAASAAAEEGDRMIGELERRLHLHNRELRVVNKRLAALSAETEHHVQTLSVLFASSVAIHRTDDIDELLQTSLGQLGELFPNHGFGIVILGDRKSDVRYRAFLRIAAPLQALLTDNAQLLGSTVRSTLRSLLLAASEAEPVTAAQAQHGGWQFLEMPDRSREAYGYLIIAGADLAPRSVEVLSVFCSQITTAIENRRLSRELEELAHTDPLTGIGNRKVLDAALDDAIRNASSAPQIEFCALVVDVNSLKPINDQYGHEAGDAVIMHVARVLRACLRREDTLARSGGDEFIVLCANTLPPGAEELADRIHRRLALHPVPRFRNAAFDHDFFATVSIGIASSIDASPDQVLAVADARMYDAKERHYASAARRTSNP